MTPTRCVEHSRLTPAFGPESSEEPLHGHLSGGTLRVGLPAKEAGGPDGIVALLRKLLRAGSAVRVEVSTW